MLCKRQDVTTLITKCGKMCWTSRDFQSYRIPSFWTLVDYLSTTVCTISTLVLILRPNNPYHANQILTYDVKECQSIPQQLIRFRQATARIRCCILTKVSEAGLFISLKTKQDGLLPHNSQSLLIIWIFWITFQTKYHSQLARHRLITQKQMKLTSAIILGIFNCLQTYKLALISFITNQQPKKTTHTQTHTHTHTYTADYSTMFRLFLTAIIWEHWHTKDIG
jgi:hypothetical protein